MRNSHVMGKNFKGYRAIDGIFYLKNKILTLDIWGMSNYEILWLCICACFIYYIMSICYIWNDKKYYFKNKNLN